jgi:amino acid permease
MGTGMLALPYAFVSGGYLFSAAGVGLLALWNAYAIDRLLRCKHMLDSVSEWAT